jgi:hypothetical protein
MLLKFYESLVAIGKHVIFKWIPSHIGIHGNTVVDRKAKNALDDPVSNCSIPYSDFKPLIVKYILKRWQDSWDQQIHSKLQKMHSLVGKTPCPYGKNLSVPFIYPGFLAGLTNFRVLVPLGRRNLVAILPPAQTSGRGLYK